MKITPNPAPQVGPLATFRLLAAIGVFVATGVTGGPALAQEPPDTVFEVEALEVVVGSRAGVADPATLPVPVDIYGAEEIARLGEVDLAEVLGRIAPSFNSTRLSAGGRRSPPRGHAARNERRPGARADQRQATSRRSVRQGACGVRARHDRHRPARDSRAGDQARRGAARRCGLAIRLGRDRRRDQYRAQGRRERDQRGHLSRTNVPRRRNEADHVGQRRCVPRGRIPECYHGGGQTGGDQPRGHRAHLLRSRPVLRPLCGWRQGHSAAAKRRARLQGRGLHGQCGVSRRRVCRILCLWGLLRPRSGLRRPVPEGRLGAALGQLRLSGRLLSRRGVGSHGQVGRGGTAGRRGRVVGRPQSRLRAGPVRLRCRELDQSVLCGRVPGQEPRRGWSVHRGQRGPAQHVQRGTERTPVDAERRCDTGTRRRLDPGIPGFGRCLPERRVLDGGRRSGLVGMRPERYPWQLSGRPSPERRVRVRELRDPGLSRLQHFLGFAE